MPSPRSDSFPNSPLCPAPPPGPLFDSGVAPLMDLTYQAYGNAKLNDTTVGARARM